MWNFELDPKEWGKEGRRTMKDISCGVSGLLDWRVALTQGRLRDESRQSTVEPEPLRIIMPGQGA